MGFICEPPDRTTAAESEFRMVTETGTFPAELADIFARSASGFETSTSTVETSHYVDMIDDKHAVLWFWPTALTDAATQQEFMFGIDLKPDCKALHILDGWKWRCGSPWLIKEGARLAGQNCYHRSLGWTIFGSFLDPHADVLCRPRW
jgi:hypothetical protein